MRGIFALFVLLGKIFFWCIVAVVMIPIIILVLFQVIKTAVLFYFYIWLIVAA